MVELWISLSNLGFPNYKISSTGKVCNVNTGHILSQYIIDGYYKVTLSNNGQTKDKFVHVLVAGALFGVCEGMTVDHKNRNKENNSIWNLRWATIQEQNLNETNTALTRSNYKIKSSG